MENNHITESCINALQNIKEKSPLVHHITNYVTVNDCANITLAIGGSPVMADDVNEVLDMVSLASSLVINIGTLNSRTVEAMLLAGKRANQLNIPVVLDPVGAGATPYRTQTAKRIIEEIKLSVIRGNLSEIKTLCGLKAATRGVDSGETMELGLNDKEYKVKQLAEMIKPLAKELNCILAVTGATDVITDGQQVVYIENGHPIMSKITGTGCMCTSLIGSYLAANKDIFIATVTAIATMGICGEIAYENLKDGEGTGSFRTRLLDAVSNFSEEHILKRNKIHMI